MNIKLLKVCLSLILLQISLQAKEIIVSKTSEHPMLRSFIYIEKTQTFLAPKLLKKKISYAEAEKYCKNLQIDDYDDWRIAYRDEMYNFYIRADFYDRYWANGKAGWEEKDHRCVALGKGSKNGLESCDSSYRLYVHCSRSGVLKPIEITKEVKTKFSKILKSLVEKHSEYSLKKSMFESKVEFEKRVSSKRFINKIAQLKTQAIKETLEIAYGKPILSDLKYDAENGYFVANLTFEAKKDFKKQKIAIQIPRKVAKKFYAHKDHHVEAIFEYDDQGVHLKRIEIPFQNKNYLASFTDMDIDNTQMVLNVSDIGGVSLGKSQVASFDKSKLKTFNDLDKLLKNAKQAKKSSKKWLFVVGIENYEFTDNISFAKRSAEMFTKMAYKSLGVPKENSYVMLNAGATQAKIKTSLKKMLRRVSSVDTIYFYYNGHGVPVPSLKNEAFMLTADTEPDYVQDEVFFSLQNIYTKLSKSKAKKVVAVVDSCFSGVTDGKSVLKGVAATRVVAKSVKFDTKKMVVLAAGKGNQYSNAYNKKGHRLFSFFVMKNILEGKKDVKSLFKASKAQTYSTSLKEYGDLRIQEPTVEGNFRLAL
jgi:hypothetical protein